MKNTFAFAHTHTACGNIRLGIDLDPDIGVPEELKNSIYWHQGKDPSNEQRCLVSGSVQMKEHDWEACPYVFVELDEKNGRIVSITHPDDPDQNKFNSARTPRL